MAYQRAFTLVELAIVLVIIGLIVGGVLVGRDLIRAAELQSVTTQEQKYVAAVHTFRLKYSGLPGDMTNATSYWGSVTDSGGTCPMSAAGVGTQTCDGDGDGAVGIFPNLNGQGYEAFTFWQQLANAGLIEGSYNGIFTGSLSTAIVPTSKIGNSLWDVTYGGTITAQVRFFSGSYGNMMVLTGNGATPNIYVGGIKPRVYPVITPEDAFNIDSKIDDGDAASGKVAAFSSNPIGNLDCTDATTNSATTANYQVTNPTIVCGIVFRQVF